MKREIEITRKANINIVPVKSGVVAEKGVKVFKSGAGIDEEFSQYAVALHPGDKIVIVSERDNLVERMR